MYINRDAGEGLAFLFIFLVGFIILAMVIGGALDIASYCTTETLSDETFAVEVVDVQVLEDGYAICVRSEDFEESWFKTTKDSLYLYCTTNDTIVIQVKQMKDFMREYTDYTIFYGESEDWSVYKVTI